MSDGYRNGLKKEDDLRPTICAGMEQLEGRQLLAVTIQYFNPTRPSGVSQPQEVIAGPDGNIWFTESFGSKIARITPAGSTTFFSTTAGSAADLTVGPDKNIWFTLPNDKKIGRMSTTGSVKLFSIPGTFNHPTGITKGPDGNVWFTDQVFGKIGRITTGGT